MVLKDQEDRSPKRKNSVQDKLKTLLPSNHCKTYWIYNSARCRTSQIYNYWESIFKLLKYLHFGRCYSLLIWTV